MASPGFSGASALSAAAIFAGGALGACARALVDEALPPIASFPASTLAVNLIGAFLLGALLEGLARSGPDAGARKLVRLLLGTGFCGAFTTYGTFVQQVLFMLTGPEALLGAAYLGLSLVGGLAGALLGIFFGRALASMGKGAGR